MNCMHSQFIGIQCVPKSGDMVKNQKKKERKNHTTHLLDGSQFSITECNGNYCLGQQVNRHHPCTHFFCYIVKAKKKKRNVHTLALQCEPKCVPQWARPGLSAARDARNAGRESPARETPARSRAGPVHPPTHLQES